jgi:3-deoxy-7-phosphoheptulonate synthase
MELNTDDTRIQAVKEVTAPVTVHEAYPISDQAAKVTYQARQDIHKILQRQDDRMLVIVGPCSIHDVDAAHEYAEKLKVIKDELADDLVIVMRVYFEKPRTTVGWKGLINDPKLDDSFEINNGLCLARGLLRDLNEMGVPAATEYLDLITPQYVADLIAWGAIGARTTESQVHRELASGLSCPVGFKNGTDGTMKIAIDAINAVAQPHHFLSVTKAGHSAIFSTTGNNDCHIILRGGKEPNYDKEHVTLASQELKSAGLPANIMVDCSHANSQKQFKRQLVVGEDIATQISAGNTDIIGVMIESHLTEGNQNLASKPLQYGQSVTDACIGWEDTDMILRKLAQAVQDRRSS